MSRSRARKLIEYGIPPFPVKGTPPPQLSLRKKKPPTQPQDADAKQNAEDRRWTDWQNQPKRTAPERTAWIPPIHVAESLIRGEFWIYEDGQVHYCDGDIGDENHESHALAHAISILSDHLAVDTEALTGDEDLYRGIVNALADDVEEGDPDASDDPEPLASVLLTRLNVPKDVIDAAFDRVDLRRYACEKWGWSAMRGDHIETWQITPEKLKVLARGVDNVLDSEGVEPEIAKENGYKLTLHISAFKGGQHLAISYDDLQAGVFERPTPVAPAPAKNAQVRDLDQQGRSSIYKGNLGDSIDAFLS